MPYRPLHALVLVVVALTVAGCPSSPSSGGDAGAQPDANLADASGADTGASVDGGGRCMAVDPLCVDQSISMLDLFATVSPAAITEEGTAPGEFTTHVDSTGGGFMPTQSFVYARFTDTGLTRVDVSDEDAFLSSDWDVAFRRFIIRLNSGPSGPSCVTAGRTAPGTTFDGLTSVPTGLTQHAEEYFTATCDLVPDGSGLGSPATVLSSFWSYPGCVAMTHNVYVIALASGRHVKLEVVGYYDTPAQTQCDTMGTIPMPSTAGNTRIRWAFLD